MPPSAPTCRWNSVLRGSSSSKYIHAHPAEREATPERHAAGASRRRRHRLPSRRNSNGLLKDFGFEACFRSRSSCQINRLRCGAIHDYKDVLTTPRFMLIKEKIRPSLIKVMALSGHWRLSSGRQLLTQADMGTGRGLPDPASGPPRDEGWAHLRRRKPIFGYCGQEHWCNLKRHGTAFDPSSRGR